MCVIGRLGWNRSLFRIRKSTFELALIRRYRSAALSHWSDPQPRLIDRIRSPVSLIGSAAMSHSSHPQPMMLYPALYQWWYTQACGIDSPSSKIQLSHLSLTWCFSPKSSKPTLTLHWNGGMRGEKTVGECTSLRCQKSKLKNLRLRRPETSAPP
jgi:hypothetical protein